jgi:predicted negative regulator of RcsB-dependent stress response
MATQKKTNEQLNVEEVVVQSEAFFIKNQKAIIIGMIVIIAIVAGYFAYKHLYAIPREEKAQIALFKGEQYFENGAYELALNGDSIGYIGFLKVIEQYNGTNAANLAKAYAGICYKQSEEYEKAIEYLSGFSGSDQMVAPSILGAIGNAYAELDQLDKASSFLIRAADKADNNALSPLFLKQAGDIFTKQEKYDDAVKVYTKIKEKYFQSPQALDIDKYIERAKMMKVK